MGENMDMLVFTKEQIACIRTSKQLPLRCHKNISSKICPTLQQNFYACEKIAN